MQHLAINELEMILILKIMNTEGLGRGRNQYPDDVYVAMERLRSKLEGHVGTVDAILDEAR
jgi:hypothetical protein